MTSHLPEYPLPDRPIMLGYIHEHPGTPAASRELLRDYLTTFAQSEGYDLDSIFIGVHGHHDGLTAADLIAHLRASGAEIVVVTGPAYGVLSALRRLNHVEVLTLVDVARRLRCARLGL